MISPWNPAKSPMLAETWLIQVAPRCQVQGGWRCLQRIRDNGNHNIEERYSVLVTPVGAIPNVIIDGKTGCIMENNSFECIVENVIRALNSPHLEENA